MDSKQLQFYIKMWINSQFSQWVNENEERSELSIAGATLFRTFLCRHVKHLSADQIDKYIKEQLS